MLFFLFIQKILSLFYVEEEGIRPFAYLLAEHRFRDSIVRMIAIDGPAGAGKSTAARALARRLGFFLLDTGALYRTLALRAHQLGVSEQDEAALGKLAETLPVQFRQNVKGDEVYLGDENVTTQIRTSLISEIASRISPYPKVREALLPLQRRLAQEGPCVVEGRDVGTVVFPQAEAKFFLTARPEVRAKRRYEELRALGLVVKLEDILLEQSIRDARDESRSLAPLRQAEDATLIDTSDLDLNQVIDFMEKVSRERLGL